MNKIRLIALILFLVCCGCRMHTAMIDGRDAIDEDGESASIHHSQKFISEQFSVKKGSHTFARATLVHVAYDIPHQLRYKDSQQQNNHQQKIYLQNPWTLKYKACNEEESICIEGRSQTSPLALPIDGKQIEVDIILCRMVYGQDNMELQCEPDSQRQITLQHEIHPDDESSRKLHHFFRQQQATIHALKTLAHLLNITVRKFNQLPSVCVKPDESMWQPINEILNMSPLEFEELILNDESHLHLTVDNFTRLMKEKKEKSEYRAILKFLGIKNNNVEEVLTQLTLYSFFLYYFAISAVNLHDSYVWSQELIQRRTVNIDKQKVTLLQDPKSGFLYNPNDKTKTLYAEDPRTKIPLIQEGELIKVDPQVIIDEKNYNLIYEGGRFYAEVDGKRQQVYLKRKFYEKTQTLGEIEYGEDSKLQFVTEAHYSTELKSQGAEIPLRKERPRFDSFYHKAIKEAHFNPFDRVANKNLRSVYSRVSFYSPYIVGGWALAKIAILTSAIVVAHEVDFSLTGRGKTCDEAKKYVDHYQQILLDIKNKHIELLTLAIAIHQSI